METCPLRASFVKEVNRPPAISATYGSRPMGLAVLCSLAVVIFLSVQGCGKSLPDAYGIYANTNHGRLQLSGQVVQRAGNIMSYYPGLIGPSGQECTSLSELIVYEKDVSPTSIGVVKLQFVKQASISNIFSATTVTVNLWVPTKDQVEVDVKPVERRQDMYILTPRHRLDNGFYAVYIGPFGGDLGTQNRVYDFVVGSAKDFPSYVSALNSRQDEVRKNAPALLDKMNQLLNQGDYQHLADVYRPDGRILEGAELQTFVTGNQTWLSTSGKVLKSELITVSPIDENSARCAVRTTYEKTGVQEESVTVRKIGGQYFVTEMK